jgi:hypothetical protein
MPPRPLPGMNDPFKCQELPIGGIPDPPKPGKPRMEIDLSGEIASDKGIAPGESRQKQKSSSNRLTIPISLVPLVKKNTIVGDLQKKIESMLSQYRKEERQHKDAVAKLQLAISDVTELIDQLKTRDQSKRVLELS